METSGESGQASSSQSFEQISDLDYEETLETFQLDSSVLNERQQSAVDEVDPAIDAGKVTVI